MVNIIQRVIDRLDEIFPEATIELGNQKQGVKLPCFFVHLINSELKRQFDNRFFLNNTISISYASLEGDLYELEDVRFRLLTGMEQIKGITGENLKATIVDKDIVMTVDYNVWIEKVNEEVLMKYLKQQGGVNNGRKQIQ